MLTNGTNNKRRYYSGGDDFDTTGNYDDDEFHIEAPQNTLGTNTNHSTGRIQKNSPIGRNDKYNADSTNFYPTTRKNRRPPIHHSSASGIDVMIQCTPRDFERLHSVLKWRPTLFQNNMRKQGRITWWSENPGMNDDIWPEYEEKSVQSVQDPYDNEPEDGFTVTGSRIKPKTIILREEQEIQCDIIPSTADKSWRMMPPHSAVAYARRRQFAHNLRANKYRNRHHLSTALKVDTEVREVLKSPTVGQDVDELGRRVPELEVVESGSEAVSGDPTVTTASKLRNSPHGDKSRHLTVITGALSAGGSGAPPTPGLLTPMSGSTMRSMLESCPWTSEVESVSMHSNMHVILQRYFEQTMAAPSPSVLAEMDRTINTCIVDAIVSLDLENLKLRQVPLQLMEASHITHLNLSRNKLTSLPSWFFVAIEKNLHYLDLSRNYLFQLPEQFSHLRKLKRVNLSYNKLQYFPPQLLNIHYLNDVNVSHNSIIAVPHDIINMKLTDLDISFNWLMSLPENFESLHKKLKFFRCQDNNFSYLTRSKVLTKLVGAMSHRKRAVSNPHQPPKPINITSTTADTLSTTSSVSTSTTTSAIETSSVATSIPHASSFQETRFSLDQARGKLPSSLEGAHTNRSAAHHKRSRSSDFAPEISALKRPILAERKEKIDFFDEYDEEQTSRVQMIMELLEFEQQYLKHLNILHDLYYTPLVHHRKELIRRYEMQESVVSRDRLSVILPVELVSIITFCRSFVIQLKEMMGNYESSPLVLREITNIGALFIEQKDFLLAHYAPYIKVHTKSIEMLKEIRDCDPGFKKFINSRIDLPLSGGMDLETLLVLPLTRIPIYTSFIRRILKATSPDHIDHAQLKAAVVVMNECLNKQQHEIFLLDNMHKIKDIQKKLKVKKNLSVAGRVLVREGRLSLAPTRQIGKIRKEIRKYITGKKSYGDYKKIQLNPYIEAAKSKIKDKSAGDMMSDLWGIRLAELYVHVYLFNDMLIVKETNMLQKLVGKVQKFDLLGSIVYPSQHKDRAICIELKNGHKLVFIAESQSQFILWLKDFETVCTEINLRYEERQELVDALPMDSDEEELSIAENTDDLSEGDEVFVDLYD